MFAKRTCLVIAVLAASPALASAQLRFAQPNANLGDLRGGPVYSHRFEFINDGQQPITITDIRLGCGCLQPVLDKRTFAPGEKGTLLMNLRTLGQPNDSRTWQAHVQYRHGDKTGECTLVVGATIRNEVTVEPSIIAMTVETTLKQELTIKDSRPMPMKVTAVTASSSAIRITTQAIDGGTKVTLEVSRSALTAVRQEETLNIYSDDPNYRHLQVPITLIRANRAEVSAAPERVEIVGVGSQLVRLRASGDKVVRIEKADADQPAIKCTWAAGPGNDATLKVSATSPYTGLVSLRVVLAQPAGEVVTVPVVLRKE